MLPLLLAAALAAPNLAPARDPNPAPDPPPPSVYKISPLWDGTVLGVSLLGVIVPYADASALIHPRCPCDPNEVNGFDRSVIGNHDKVADSVSDATAAVALLGPPVAELALLGVHRETLEDLTVEGEAIAVAGALVTLAKYTVQRPLPLVYAGQAPDLIGKPGGYRSFYSGHTTLTFAALMAASTTWTLRRGPSVWPWIASTAVGASVMAERVAAGRHFYTDVLVGAATGVGVGLLVPWLHERKGAGQLVVLPREGGAEVGWAAAF